MNYGSLDEPCNTNVLNPTNLQKQVISRYENMLLNSNYDVIQDHNHLQFKEKEKKKPRVLKKEGLEFTDRTR